MPSLVIRTITIFFVSSHAACRKMRRSYTQQMNCNALFFSMILQYIEGLSCITFFLSSFAVTTGTGSTTKNTSVGTFELGNLSWKQMRMKKDHICVLIQRNLSPFKRWLITLHPSSSAHWLCFFLFLFILASNEHLKTILLQDNVVIYYEMVEKRTFIHQYRM